MAIPWASILSAGIVPLVKWAVEFGVERRDKRKKKAKKRAKKAEKKRLKTQAHQRIREAKEGYKDVDPSEYDV
jgi:hypothetical protein